MTPQRLAEIDAEKRVLEECVRKFARRIEELDEILKVFSK